MTTLAKVQTANATTATVIPAIGEVKTEMSVMLPPGFAEQTRGTMVFIGGEAEGGPIFYQWNSETEERSYVPVNRFTGRLVNVKTVIRNPDDKLTRSVKLLCEFETATGDRVTMQCGANTYSSLGLISGLSACSADQIKGEIGLSGRTGQSARVTFVNVFAEGGRMRNPDAEELLKEAKNDGVMTDAIEGYIADINAKLAS